MNEEYKHEHETVGFSIPGLPEETVRFMQEKMEKAEKEIGKERTSYLIPNTPWVERQVPEHLEDAAHDLITALLKSHGYNWEGEKQ